MTTLLAEKALSALLKEHADHTDFAVKHAGGLLFKVVGDLYHDCDRAPSYMTTDDILVGLNRIEAEQLKSMLELQEAAIRKRRERRG